MSAIYKLLPAILVLGAVASAEAADNDQAAASSRPQTRIDSSTLESPVPRRARAEPSVLPSYVVRERRVKDPTLFRRPGVEDTTGNFDLLKGGRFGKVGPFEVGIWGHIDIFAPDAPAQAFDFLRWKF